MIFDDGASVIVSFAKWHSNVVVLNESHPKARHLYRVIVEEGLQMGEEPVLDQIDAVGLVADAAVEGAVQAGRHQRLGF